MLKLPRGGGTPVINNYRPMIRVATLWVNVCSNGICVTQRAPPGLFHHWQKRSSRKFNMGVRSIHAKAA